MRSLEPTDFAAVKDAVADVEKKTRGEIVPLVIADAGEYGWVRDRAAVVGLVLALVGGELWSMIRTWPLDASEVTTLVLGGALFGAALGSVPAIVRLLVGKRRVSLAVHRRALAEFTGRGCGNTREQTGILVMVALFERRIEIIADRGIQRAATEKEGADVWNRITAEFSATARAGRPVDGLVEVIRRLGEVLEKHFPPDGIAGNELPNDLLTED